MLEICNTKTTTKTWVAYGKTYLACECETRYMNSTRCTSAHYCVCVMFFWVLINPHVCWIWPDVFSRSQQHWVKEDWNFDESFHVHTPDCSGPLEFRWCLLHFKTMSCVLINLWTNSSLVLRGWWPMACWLTLKVDAGVFLDAAKESSFKFCLNNDRPCWSSPVHWSR